MLIRQVGSGRRRAGRFVAMIMVLAIGLVMNGAVSAKAEPPAPPGPPDIRPKSDGSGSSVTVRGKSPGKAGSRSGGGIRGGGSGGGRGSGGGSDMVEYWNSDKGLTTVAPRGEAPEGYTGTITYPDRGPSGGRGGGPRVDPGAAAERAVAKINLRAVAPGLSPDWTRNEYGMIPVGFPVWVYVEPDSVVSVSDSETVEGLTVALRADAPRVAVAMGDGATLQCAVQGRAFVVGRDRPGADGPCSHRYQQMSGRAGYRVTATYVWDVAWRAGGQSGVITVTERASRQIPVGELQALVVAPR